MNCANGDVSIDVASKQIVSASAKVCIQQSQKIDEPSRVLILQTLGKAEEEAKNKTDESALWRACYKKVAGI